MNIVLLFLVCLILYKAKLKNNKDYLSKEKTMIIKGIFIVIVFVSHINGYALYNSNLDNLAIKIINIIGQLMVAMFLFYSGYGIFKSIKLKGISYIDNIPKKRILNTFYNFWLAILLFILLNILLNINYPVDKIILSFIGWESIGNSNWYIFIILVMYFATWISFKIIKNNNYKSLILNTFLCLTFVSFMSFIKEPYWVDTCLCYIFGMWYCYYQNLIENILCNKKLYYFSVSILVLFFTILYIIFGPNIYIDNIIAICFCLIIVLLTMKIELNSKALCWCGQNLFWLYILQRIPMILFSKIGLIGYNKYIYFVVCLLFTIVSVLLINYIIEKLKKLLKK